MAAITRWVRAHLLCARELNARNGEPRPTFSGLPALPARDDAGLLICLSGPQGFTDKPTSRSA